MMSIPNDPAGMRYSPLKNKLCVFVVFVVILKKKGKIIETVKKEGHIEKAIKPGLIICPHCSSEIQLGGDHCPYCGVSLKNNKN